jgi:hypothetical protein
LSAQWLRTSSPAGERNQQRDERDPGKGRMSELRESKREQNARDQR